MQTAPVLRPLLNRLATLLCLTLALSETLAAQVSQIFGQSVAISDGYAVVGAPGDGARGARSGAAYVFDVRAGWHQVAKLTANDGSAGDEFGISVAISGQYIVIGAYRDGSETGSAYIFSTVGYGQVAKLTASDGSAGDRFGSSVAIHEGRAVVGAPNDDPQGTYSGSAYVFDVRFDWTQQAKISAGSNGSANDVFGTSVSIHNEYVVAEAPLDDALGSNSGAAYVFSRLSGYGRVARLLANDGSIGDEFGYSVALNDGYTVVGAYGDASYRGAAYIFDVRTG